MKGSQILVLVACLVIALGIVAFGWYMQQPTEEPPPPPPLSPEQQMQAFMKKMNEWAGVEKVEGNKVTVGPKFATLSTEDKERNLNLLASHVLEVSAEKGLRPDQKLIVVDESGKQIATYSSEGLKLE